MEFYLIATVTSNSLFQVLTARLQVFVVFLRRLQSGSQRLNMINYLVIHSLCATIFSFSGSDENSQCGD